MLGQGGPTGDNEEPMSGLMTDESKMQSQGPYEGDPMGIATPHSENYYLIKSTFENSSINPALFDTLTEAELQEFYLRYTPAHPLYDLIYYNIKEIEERVNALKISFPGNVWGNWIWPTTGRVTSEAGVRTHPTKKVRQAHGAIDIANAIGTPIVAGLGGVVTHSYKSSSYGNVVFLDHGMRNGIRLTSRYAHMDKRSVKKGEIVSQGTQLGELGNTGDSTGPHLHFEIREDGSKVDPRTHVAGNP